MGLGLGKMLKDAIGGGAAELVGTLGNVADKFITTGQEKKEFQAELQKAANDFFIQKEQLILNAFEAEVKDRDSARAREAAIAATGKFDFMMYLTGLVGLGAFCFMIYALAYLDIPADNKELFIHAIGIIEGVVISIFAYYFGTSKSSSEKTKLLSNGQGKTV